MGNKVNEKELFGSLRTYTNSKPHIHLVSLLECRLDKLKNELIEAGNVDEYRRVQGRAKEIQYLINGLTRKALKPQYTGAFD